jgi:hypothetical protein
MLTKSFIQRLLLVAICVIIVGAIGQYLYNNVRLNSGPNAWFVISQRVDRNASLHSANTADLLGGPFSTRAACEKWLTAKRLGTPSILYACERLLLTDASRLSQ